MGLLVSPDLSDDAKAGLAARYGQYNPVELQREVHQAVDALMLLKRADGT